MKPKGGTELMFEEFKKRIDPSVFEKFSIFNYPSDADFNKKTVYWNQLSYDQEAVSFLGDLGYVQKIDHFVFVSYWQSEIFRKAFNIPSEKIKVIKNACLGTGVEINKKNEKTKICYTSTPWRGLNVLLKAWEQLSPKTCELHVFSSSKIYGSNFESSVGNSYDGLYEKCESLNNIVYRGFVHNEELRKELPSFDLLAYPSTFEETSCISVIEALSAGLRVVTSSLGALPETTEGWARMYPFQQDPSYHADLFAKVLKDEVLKIKKGELQQHLENQVNIYAPKWNWDARIKEWKAFLNEIS